MNTILPNISISDYSYELPEERIALIPLADRTASKMLVYKKAEITDSRFRHMADFLPPESFIVLNETKVINARLLFRKESGGQIELFCLDPHEQYRDMTVALAQKGSVNWYCLVGGRKKWKDHTENIYLQAGEHLMLKATLISESGDRAGIRFEWNDTDMSFAEVLEQAGTIPLPPYIKRAAGQEDIMRYQSVFAAHEGSVAAPTASLHLTQELLQELAYHHHIHTITLHVGAGTFMPVKDNDISRHKMHEEWMSVPLCFLEAWYKHILHGQQPHTLAVGTTACRTMESLYWIGVQLLAGLPVRWDEVAVSQWDAYELPQHYSLLEAVSALITYMKEQQVDVLQTKTQLLILPGYTFRSIDMLVTNFHQPCSTLLLLVAAFCGAPYKDIYRHALDHEYRFLSYGDGSLLFTNQV